MGQDSGGIQPHGNPDLALYNIRYARREVTVHQVTDGELDTVASLSNSVHLALLGMCGGAFLTLLITLLTVQISDAHAFMGFVGATIVTFIGTLYFGINARISYKSAERKLKEIKQPLA